MNQLKAKHLNEILDPQTRFVFFEDEGFTEAVFINSLESNNTFIIHLKGKGLLEAKRRGYFVATNGQGIVRFDGDCQLIEKSKNEETPIYRLTINMQNLNLINRREFLRHEFKKPIPIVFNYDNRTFMAHLVNISTSGLRMAVEEKLPSQEIYHFEVKLPFNQSEFKFLTDGLVIYSEPEKNPEVFMTGVSFVAPQFKNETELKKYRNQKVELDGIVNKLNQFFRCS